MNIFNYLKLRNEFEEIVRSYKLSGKNQGTIQNMKYFLSSGMKRNRFRAEFDKATEICKTVTQTL